MWWLAIPMSPSSSGTLRSRFPSTPSSPLTDKKITAYLLAGKYGEFARQQELKRQARLTLKKKKKPTTIRVYKNSLALTDISHLL